MGDRGRGEGGGGSAPGGEDPAADQEEPDSGGARQDSQLSCLPGGLPGGAGGAPVGVPQLPPWPRYSHILVSLQTEI